MTAYFDKMTTRIHNADEEGLAFLDEELLRDMSLATLEPGFPPELRNQIDRLLLEWSRSANARLIAAPWTGPSDERDHRECLQHLIWHLHTCFHELAGMVKGRGDGPLVWIASLEAEAEERREALAQRLRGKVVRPWEDLAPTRPVKTRIARAVQELRELASFLRNEPTQFEDQDDIELFISGDDAMTLELIAKKLETSADSK